MFFLPFSPFVFALRVLYYSSCTTSPQQIKKFHDLFYVYKYHHQDNP